VEEELCVVNECDCDCDCSLSGGSELRKCSNVEFTGKYLVKLYANGIKQEDTALNWRLLENRKKKGNLTGEEKRGGIVMV
jgi:hypothetical protein